MGNFHSFHLSLRTAQSEFRSSGNTRFTKGFPYTSLLASRREHSPALAPRSLAIWAWPADPVSPYGLWTRLHERMLARLSSFFFHLSARAHDCTSIQFFVFLFFLSCFIFILVFSVRFSYFIFIFCFQI